MFESFPTESLLVLVISLIWVIQIINSFTGYRMSQFGIVPRTVRGLIGIFISPFIHHSYAHVSANSVPLLILGLGVNSNGFQYFLSLTVLIIIIGGSLVWVFARTASHSGASSLIFGFFGVNLYSFFDNPNLVSGAVTFVTILIYGSLIREVLPADKDVSWEGHLFGFVTGVGVLYFDVV